MMYDELIKRLRWCASYDPRIVIQDCNDAADAIEDLWQALDTAQGVLAEQPPTWIPVTERLPEGDANVLLCYEWTGRSGTIYREVGITSIPEIDNDPTEMLRPLYWMPLPEPPEREE